MIPLFIILSLTLYIFTSLICSAGLETLKEQKQERLNIILFWTFSQVLLAAILLVTVNLFWLL